MGIYGEGGFKLNKLFALKLGYFWPWTINSSTGAWGPDPNNPDHLVASFEIEKGVIPIVNLWGSVSYERTSVFAGGNIPSSFQNALFGPNTVLIAQINYPVSPIMDVSLLYTTTPVMDSNGQLHYSGNNVLHGHDNDPFHHDGDSPVNRGCQNPRPAPGGSGSSGTRCLER